MHDLPDKMPAPEGPDAAEQWTAGATLGAPLASTDDGAVSLPWLPLAGESDAPSLELGPPLGQGGVGVVLEGVQLGLGRAVAVKCPRADRDDARTAAILVREARIAGGLEHPNILPVHALGRDVGGRPLVVMPRVTGRTWHALIGQANHPLWGPFDGDLLERNLRVLMGVCRAVQFAHEGGVAHRDLKPENVMIGEFGQVLLVDWGLAVRLEEAPHTTAVVGTPGYMAPEMFELGAPVDARTDVYLLGAILHEVLTGHRRHPGSTLDAVAAHTRASADFAYGPEVPAPLAEVANRACALRPEVRFATAEGLRQAIAAFLVHRESLALTTRAERELAQLIDETEAEAREARFGACRFGFGEALRMWPENPRARAGLGQAVALLIERELERGAPDAARRLMAELPEPRPDLAAAIEAALARSQGDRARLATLEAEARARDPRVQSVWRTVQLATVWVFFVVGPIVAGFARRQGVLPAEPPPLVRVILPLTLGVVALLWVRLRARSFPTGYDRRLMLALAGTLLALSSAWAGALVSGASFVVTQAQVPPVLAALCAGLAAGLDRRFWGPALVYVVATPFVAAEGEVALGVANGLSMALITWSDRRLARAPA
jgi:serine/threonine-protein kinase